MKGEKKEKRTRTKERKNIIFPPLPYPLSLRAKGKQGSVRDNWEEKQREGEVKEEVLGRSEGKETRGGSEKEVLG